MNLAGACWLLTIALLVFNLAGLLAISYWLVFLPVLIVHGVQLVVFFTALAIIVSASK